MSVAAGEDVIGLPLTLFLCQLLLIVGMCKIMSLLCKRIKQPSVIAEVITGIILGPSVFGYIPNYLERMFPPSSMSILQVIANVGLILFMFLVGLEIDVRLLKNHWRQSIAISATAMVLPFGLGAASSLVIYNTLIDKDKVAFGDFLLFIGVAISITAFPVLARILSEFEMLKTKLGTTALSAAAVDDVVYGIAWIALAVVVAAARATSPLDALYTFLMLVGFVGIMITGGRKALAWLIRKTCTRDHLSPLVVITLLLLIFLSAWLTEIIGVHAIFGGFVTGIIVPRKDKVPMVLTERFEDIVVVLLLPLYFAFSGLRTNLGSLNSGTSWGCLLLITTAACFGKISGSIIASKLLKHPWRESVAIGVLMNTKGLVELIVLNIGLDVGVLNEEVFTIFVVMALITTFMTTPLLHLVWLSHQRKSPKDKKAGKLYVNLYISNADEGATLTSISKLLVASVPHYKTKVIHFSQVSDRPSTYFFLVNNIHNNLDKVSTPPQLQLAGERAKAIGIRVKPRIKIADDIPKAVADHAVRSGADIAVLVWDTAEEPGRTIQAMFEEKQSYAIGILAEKGEKKSQYTHLRMVFTGMQHENGVLHLLKMLIQSTLDIHVHLFTITEASSQVQDYLKNPKLSVTIDTKPFEAVTATINDEVPYDLIICGIAKTWLQETTAMDLVKNSASSVLFLHGSTDISFQKMQDFTSSMDV